MTHEEAMKISNHQAEIHKELQDLIDLTHLAFRERDDARHDAMGLYNVFRRIISGELPIDHSTVSMALDVFATSNWIKGVS